MPVEECGNMQIMLRAAEKADGDTSLTQKYLPLLTKWAGYRWNTATTRRAAVARTTSRGIWRTT
jgi:hypothetical protein